MLRLQGFPESFKITVGYGAMRKLAGNSVAIPVVAALVKQVIEALEKKAAPLFEYYKSGARCFLHTSHYRSHHFLPYRPDISHRLAVSAEVFGYSSVF